MAATATVKFAGFADKQPAFLRSVIVPEDQDAFDEQYRAAVASAAETLDLTELEEFLQHWRRQAWLQQHMGHDRYRAMLERAEYTLHTGSPPPGTRVYSEEEMAELLAAKLVR